MIYQNEVDRPYHKVADLFPLMQGDEFEELKADIATNGLIDPIWLHPDGSIIDGRNRHRACLETNTQPRFETWNDRGSLVSFVVSRNLKRRHLTSSQRAMAAQDVLPMLEEEVYNLYTLSGDKDGDGYRDTAAYGGWYHGRRTVNTCAPAYAEYYGEVGVYYPLVGPRLYVAQDEVRFR